MSGDEDANTEKNSARELTREEANKKRDYFLALARKNTSLEDEIDSADSTMATLILPGG